MRDQKQQNHNQQKKIALVNDFTGFGRCSIAVQLPVISMMKVQCCAVPTAIFSDHTAYDSFYCTDYDCCIFFFKSVYKLTDDPDLLF